MYVCIYDPLDSEREQNGNGSVKGLLDNGATIQVYRRRERLHMRIERIASGAKGVRMQNADRRRYRSDMNSWYPELRLDRKHRRSTVLRTCTQCCQPRTPRHDVNVTLTLLPTFLLHRCYNRSANHTRPQPVWSDVVHRRACESLMEGTISGECASIRCTRLYRNI